ncbi:hypothetical protein [Halotalea alkalilenta]|uniref:hypothetical protein n=1 Tax=Halotalea alkalilenta TaxID=376489 RepID=UPI000487E0F7|nr:hypothetical protein [Halotalea alkalilenta]
MAFIASLLDHLTTLRARRHHRRAERSLRGLPAYLLKDMGLHYEAGELRPLASESDQTLSPAPPKLTLILGGAGREEQMFHVKRRRQEAPPVCRHCGAPLP